MENQKDNTSTSARSIAKKKVYSKRKRETQKGNAKGQRKRQRKRQRKGQRKRQRKGGACKLCDLHEADLASFGRAPLGRHPIGRSPLGHCVCDPRQRQLREGILMSRWRWWNSWKICETRSIMQRQMTRTCCSLLPSSCKPRLPIVTTPHDCVNEETIDWSWSGTSHCQRQISWQLKGLEILETIDSTWPGHNNNNNNNGPVNLPRASKRKMNPHSGSTKWRKLAFSFHHPDVASLFGVHVIIFLPFPPAEDIHISFLLIWFNFLYIFLNSSFFWFVLFWIMQAHR